MIIPIPVYIAFYFVGVILSFDVLTSKLNRKFPKLEYNFPIKFLVLLVCLFSWLALYFIVTNKNLEE